MSIVPGTQIRVGMARVTPLAGPIHFYPTVDAKLGRDGKWFPGSLTALVDSGAAFTLVNMDLARRLEYDPGELRKGKAVQLTGVGTTSVCFEASADIQIGYDSSECVFLGASRVFFTDAPLPRPILLGQCDALERMKFWHHNQSPDPYVLLRRV